METIGEYSVHHLGLMRDDMVLQAVYCVADVFVCPSREENLPNTVWNRWLVALLWQLLPWWAVTVEDQVMAILPGCKTRLILLVLLLMCRKMWNDGQ